MILIWFRYDLLLWFSGLVLQLWFWYGSVMTLIWFQLWFLMWVKLVLMGSWMLPWKLRRFLLAHVSCAPDWLALGEEMQIPQWFGLNLGKNKFTLTIVSQPYQNHIESYQKTTKTSRNRPKACPWAVSYTHDRQQADRQTDSQPDSQTARQPDRQPDSQTARQQTDRQTDTHAHTHARTSILVYIHIIYGINIHRQYLYNIIYTYITYITFITYNR